MQVDPIQALKSSGAHGALSRNRTRLMLVVLQVALSFALLVSAALFVRSLAEISAIRGGAEAIPTIFRAAAQVPKGIPHQPPMLLVRTTGEAAERRAAVHAALQGLRPDLPYVDVAPLGERLQELRPFQLGALLFTSFAVLALLLSAAGLYAVLGYFVAERTGEAGIRRAFGAPGVEVMRLIVRQSLIPVGMGLAIGLCGALAGTRVLASHLYGIAPLDPIALGTAAACLITAAALATVVPVRRAIRIDPTAALRHD